MQTQREIYKTQHISVRQCLYVTSNTKGRYEAQFIKKKSNTEAELKKKTNAYKEKACILIQIVQ